MAHQCDGLALGHLQINVLQHLTVLKIAERHVVQFDLILKRSHWLWLGRLSDRILSLQDKVDTVHRCQADGYLVGGLRQVFDGIDDAV